MQMYAVQLGKVSGDGFKLMETTHVLASTKEAAQARLVDVFKTRGVQIGANRAMLMGENGASLFEFP